MKVRILVIVIATTALACFEVLACGDSLYRVGKGVSYRVYTAPLPGSVLVYGQGENAQQLAEALAQSGHGVRLVDNPADLDTEMQYGSYDVVIAAYSDHEAIETLEAAGNATGSEPEYLPVALSKEEESQAKQNYDKVMLAERDDIKHYLKAIHKTLKQKT